MSTPTSKFLATAEELEQEQQCSIGWAIQYIEDGNLDGFKWLVPGVVKPSALSAGSGGQKRTIESIARYHADQSGDRRFVDYLDGLQSTKSAPTPDQDSAGRR